MNVIFTNDDGINAPGIRALVDFLPKKFKAIVVAPATERSATSHSISLGQKLRVEEYVQTGIRHFKVHGTPADCVKFAVAEINFQPDLIVSGINLGANTGISVYYSGTISAAREGLINRVPAMAVSLCSRNSRDFRVSVNTTLRLMDGYGSGLFPKDVLLSVNVPALRPEEVRGIKVTRQAPSRFVEEFIKEKEHDGKRVYSLAGEIELFETDGTSDEEAVSEGYVSLTPLQLDVTAYPAIPAFERWIKEQ